MIQTHYTLKDLSPKLARPKSAEKKGQCGLWRGKRAVFGFNPPKSDDASQPPGWWPNPARYEEYYRCV